MLVDVHTHFFKYPDHFTEDFRDQARRARTGVEVDLTVRWDEYYATGKQCDKTIVFGGKAKLSGLWVPDAEVAAYARQHPDKLIPFLSVDPTQPGWQEELIQGHQDSENEGNQTALNVRRVQAQPARARLSLGVCRQASLARSASHRHNLHRQSTLGMHVAPTAGRSGDSPPEGQDHHGALCRIRMKASVSSPSANTRTSTQTAPPCTIGPFQLYHSLMLVQEYGVWDKVLFGTDYPFTTVDASIDGIRKLNDMLAGTALPRLNTGGHREDVLPGYAEDPGN